MGVRDTNRCDATVLNIQKFEEDKLEGRETGGVVVPVVYPGPPDEECTSFFESGLARLSRF
jgi:hypothetical protein